MSARTQISVSRGPKPSPGRHRAEDGDLPSPTSRSPSPFPDRDDPRWQPMRLAPIDGSPIWLWVVHSGARYVRDPVADGYEAACRAEWIDHNGGGWTWQGVAGALTKWMPRDDGLNIYGQPIQSTA